MADNSPITSKSRLGLMVIWPRLRGSRTSFANMHARTPSVLTIFENERPAEIDLTYLNRGIAIDQRYAAEALGSQEPQTSR